MKKWIREVLDFARDNQLDLSSKREDVPMGEIDTIERVDRSYVRKVRAAFEACNDWPKSMPLIVLCKSGSRYMVLDGHHRLAAWEEVWEGTVPALVVSCSSYYEIQSEFDVPRVDYVNEILAAADDLVSRNVKKGKGGSVKVRG